MQTKKHSLLESLTNIAIGYVVAVSSQVIIFPWFDIDIPLSDNFIIGFYFTCISLLRSYILRRYFNRKTMKIIKGLDVVFVDDIENDKSLTQKEKEASLEWYKKTLSKATYRTKFIQ